MKTIVVDRTPSIFNFEKYNYFPTEVNYTNVLDYIELCKTISYELIQNSQITSDQCMVQTGFLGNDQRLSNFNQLLLDSCWNILYEQGYDVENFRTVFQDFWVHYHLKNSYVEKHSHGEGSQLSGIYILEVPDNNRMYIHDPRNSVNQMRARVKNTKDIKVSTSSIYFDLKPGDLYIFNSWLEHSMPLNRSNDPFTFLHFNIDLVHSTFFK